VRYAPNNPVSLVVNHFRSVILSSDEQPPPKSSRCNSDKAHFNQIIKSKVRMNRMNLFSALQGDLSVNNHLLLHAVHDHDQRCLVFGFGEDQTGRDRDHLPRCGRPYGKRQCHVYRGGSNCRAFPGDHAADHRQVRAFGHERFKMSGVPENEHY
jgi:hypothetical protein